MLTHLRPYSCKQDAQFKPQGSELKQWAVAFRKPPSTNCCIVVSFEVNKLQVRAAHRHKEQGHDRAQRRGQDVGCHSAHWEPVHTSLRPHVTPGEQVTQPYPGGCQSCPEPDLPPSSARGVVSCPDRCQWQKDTEPQEGREAQSA